MLKVGIIGSGFGLYGLLPAFVSIKSCKVVSICGKKTERLINYCEEISLSNIYSDWKKMLDNEQLDAIAIAVTPGIQYEIAKIAIAKGIHIFAEKPLALNYKQAKELYLLAKKKKITHAVDFIFPEIDEWQKTKQLLDKKKFGELKHISINWDFLSFDIKNKINSWKTDVDKGGGALSFYFSHSLNYLEYYGGILADVKSQLSYSKKNINGGETGVDILLKFKNGVTGSAHICTNCKGLSRHQLIFHCETGTIVLENENSVVDNFHIQTISESGKKKVFVFKHKANGKNIDERVKIVRKLANRFIEGCSNKKTISPSFKEGLRVQELIEEIRKQQI